MGKKTPKIISTEDLEIWEKITSQLKRNKPVILINKQIRTVKI